ncbi:hypothetical protein IWQ56_005718, partial [Coemansia nantahalensis]
LAARLAAQKAVRLAVQQAGQPKQAEGAAVERARQDRLRSKGGAGSPLIRQALSIKKDPQEMPGGDKAAGAAAARNASLPKPEAAVKRSKSVVGLGGEHGLLLSVPGLTGGLDLSAETNAALEASMQRNAWADGAQQPASPRASSRARKNEWINNTQYVRQRLAGSRTGSGALAQGAGASTVGGAPARKRQSSVDAGLRSVLDDGFFGSTQLGAPRSRSSVAVGSATATSFAAAAAAAASSSGSGSAMGARQASLPRRSGSNAPARQASLGSRAANVDADARQVLVADLEGFASVTFDAGTLFQQSLLDGVNSPSPSLASAGTVMSPAQYMATFSDVRRGLGQGRSAAAAAEADHTSSSRFLSKVKHAFTGGRHGPAQHRRPDRQRDGKEARQRSSSDASGSPRVGESLKPLQLDLDMGSSLLTPESLHRHVQDEGADEPEPASSAGVPALLPPHGPAGVAPASAAAAQTPAAKDAGGAAAQMANDSAYYLIDYINAQE